MNSGKLLLANPAPDATWFDGECVCDLRDSEQPSFVHHVRFPFLILWSLGGMRPYDERGVTMEKN